VVPRQKRFPVPSYRYLRVPYRGRAFSVPPLFRWAAVALALVLYVFQFVAGDRGLLHRFQVRRELEMMQAENTRLAIQKDRLLQEVQLKENDPMSLERLAREKYWMAAPGEQIYRFREDEVVPEEDDAVQPWVRGPGVEGGSAADGDADSEAGEGPGDGR